MAVEKGINTPINLGSGNGVKIREIVDQIVNNLSDQRPAGTVSGAPKIRAMEIIDELEITKRKVYAGGIGYFSANGEFDTCIALRTAVAKNNKFYVQAGAGIVADSDPIKEYEETVNKAKALLSALK